MPLFRTRLRVLRAERRDLHRKRQTNRKKIPSTNASTLNDWLELISKPCVR